MLIDIHVHTQASPGGKFSAGQLLDEAVRRGLDGVCLTDVHQFEPALQARQQANQEQLTVLVGLEAITDRGHYLVFVPHPENLPVLDRWLRFVDEETISFQSLAEAVRAQQGIIIAAHPYDRANAGSPGDRLSQMERLAGIEIINGSRPALANELAEEMAAGLGLVGVGGSDTRGDLKALGKVGTLLADAVTNETELIERILAGDAWAVTIGKPAARAGRRRGQGGRTESDRDKHPRRAAGPRGRGRRASRDGDAAKKSRGPRKHARGRSRRRDKK